MEEFYWKILAKQLLVNMEDFSVFLGHYWRLVYEITPLAKSVLIPLGLTVAALATDAAIQKKIWIRGEFTDNFEWKNKLYHQNS